MKRKTLTVAPSLLLEIQKSSYFTIDGEKFKTDNPIPKDAEIRFVEETEGNLRFEIESEYFTEEGEHEMAFIKIGD